MRSVPALLLANKTSRAPTIAWGLAITRPDNTEHFFTSHDVNRTIAADTYLAAPGIDWASLVITSGLQVDNSEITALDDGTIFTRADVMQRLWVNSAFALFEFNWASPSDGIDTRLVGNFGELQLKRSTVVIELRGLTQYLQQPVGPVSQKTCRNRLGVDDGMHSFCNVAMGPFTHSGTVTAVANPAQFTDSGLAAQPSDRFGEGTVLWLTGNNAGVLSHVKSFAAGVFGLTKPLLTAIQIGDTFTAVAGCRKRLIEDCKTKFNKVQRFQGEPYRKTPTEVLKAAEP
jgi:uncharacterized phage protein (TIGR02218 family)